LGFVPPRAIPSSVMKNWPVYTPAAKQAHREGAVMLSVKISAEGSPLDVSVARSSNFPDLDLAAVAAVRNCKFTPATKNGLPTETTVNLPVNFSLKAAEKTPTPPADTDKNKPPATSQPQPKPTHPAAAKPATPKPEAPKPATSAPTSAPTQPTQPPQ
jgi:TonB family protein